MTEYHVEYRIETEANSPMEAAEQVAALLMERADRGVYSVREHVEGSVEVEIDLDSDLRECDACGDEVATLSSDDLCDGCVAEGKRRCPNCGEWKPADEMNHWPKLAEPISMCDSCEHDARRSGWEPGR